MFTVLSPCAFIATVYMLLGRLAIHLDADEFLLVKSRIITKIFLTSDIECNLPRNKAEFFSHWTTLAGTLAISCIGILVRSVFRTIENSQGYHGYLATHEVYFYVLDTLPLFIATVVFVITWPPLYLTQYGHANSVDWRQLYPYRSLLVFILTYQGQRYRESKGGGVTQWTMA
ncbi:unnamed protein product [Rhizoctonia solani]|uniref:Uncharacterized protein n=1 Tax=Rhizoctonia solani TaxID=456999 RepID=A0A8H3CFC6_9AGAM|nr:unnamed protein product [Rhizoctonia solani]